MKKRILSTLLALCVVLTLLPTEVLAAESGTTQQPFSESVPADEDVNISDQSDMSNAPEDGFPDIANNGIDTQASDTDIAYPVTGGNIYFDAESGTITNCDASVTTAVIPSMISEVAVTGIGDRAFSGRRYLDSITIPDSVVSVGNYAFENCSSLTSITILDGVIYIGDYAFRNCSSLPNITIPGSITNIGNYAFLNCNSFTHIIIPDNVTTIKNGTFSGCSSLNSIIIPDDITSIGDRAFDGCSKLSSIIIPGSVTSVGENAFVDCIGLTTAGPIGGGYDYEFGWTHDIPDNAFEGCSSLTSISIPDDIVRIGDHAFSRCSQLASISIPTNVTSIGFYAFSGCNSLGSISIPANVTSIGLGAFSGCTSLFSAGPIGGGYDYEFGWTQNIPNSAFGNCSSLTSISIPNSITRIGSQAFWYCSNLTRIIIPDGVTSIGESAFYECDGLTSIAVPAGITTIGDKLFNGCDSLKNVIIPDSVTLIKEAAFSGCEGLKDVYYGGSNEQWQTISIYSENDPLATATIHYNSTGPDNIGQIDTASVHFFSSWNPATRNVSFDEQPSPYSLAASIDMSYAEALVGKYVLVTMNPESVLEVADIQPVESDFGKVTMSSERTLTIGGTEYPVSSNYLALDRFVGSEVLYHIYEGTIVSIEVLQGKLGKLEHYDSATGILTINNVGYSVPYFLEISSDDIITCLLQKIKFVCDGLNHIYRIELYDDGGENIPVLDFNVDIYRANWMQNSNPTVEGINRILRDETPSAELVSNLQKTGFDEAVVAWDAFDLISSTLDNPTALADFAAEPKDLYSAIILNALEVSVSYDIIDKEIEDAYKEAKKLMSTIQDSMKIKWNIDIYNSTAFKNLSGSQRDQVVEETKSWFKENFDEKYAELNLVSSVLDGITKGFKAIGSIEDYCERIVSCLIVAETNEYLKEVLRQAYQDSLQGNNPYLQLALSDCVSIMNSSSEELMKKLIGEGVTAIGVNVGSYFIKELLWKQVKTFIIAEFPAIAVFQQAYKNAKYASNLLFSTDNLIEQYLDMVAVSDIETLVDSSVAKLNRKFNQDRTISTASTYLAGVNFVFTLRDIDTQKAYGFADELDDAWLNRIWEFLSGKDNFTDAKSYYKTRQAWYTIEKENFLTGWVNYLEEDYPDTGLYSYYSYLLDESSKRILTKEFVAACPIDVLVFDASNELVASIVDGRVSCSGEVMVALIGDTKVVRFFDEQDYRIEYIGTAAGEMDVTISEFNTDGEVVRTVNYYDITLTDDKVYTVNVDDTILNTNPYELKEKSTGEIVDYDYDSLLTRDARKHTVSIQSGSMIQNGEISLSTEAVCGETIEIFSYIPDGSTFLCWESSNGKNIFANETAMSTTFIMPDEDIVIKAIIQNTDTPASYTIIFDATGGIVEPTSMTTNESGTLASLPTPTRDGYISTGWYTAPTEGIRITLDTVFDQNTTVYAQWIYDNGNIGSDDPYYPGNGESGNSGSSNGPSYSIIIPSAITGGNVTVSPQRAKKGDTVTVTTTSDNGYELSSLMVVDSKGNQLELTDKDSGKYIFIMPDTAVTISAVFELIENQSAAPTAPDWLNPFTDVAANTWYYEAVKFVSENGLMNGIGNTTFAPDANLSRAQFAQILYNKEGKPAISGSSPFTDVAAGTWYSDAVIWAAANNIVSGYGNGLFGPDDNITREQLAVMLWRYAGSPPATNKELHFSDTDMTSTYALDAVHWAVENGILSGKGSGVLDPTGSATRAEAAQMLMNLLAN